MGRTALFSRLRQLVAVALSEPSTASEPRAPTELGRRELLVASAASAASAAGVLSCTAKSEDPRGSSGPPPSVAVVGAGLAGLHCAYWLQKAGVDVTVYEASDRIGGRTFTERDLLPDGLVCELGGEFFDASHLTLQFLIDEFDLSFDDRYAEAELRNDVFWVDDGFVNPRDLLDQLHDTLPAITAAIEAADRDPEPLDRTPLSVWIEANLVNRPELAAVLTSAYRGEFGLETDEQSALNLIYLVGLDTETLRIFGELSHRYHVSEGSSAFAERLAEALDDSVVMGRRLVAVERDSDSGYTLTFETPARIGEQVRVGRVVFALPFSVLRSVDLERAGLSDEKREIIANLGYGTNAKIVGAFADRVWSSGSVTSDLPFQQVWDSSLGQPGPRGVLTNFLGGNAGLESDAGTAEERMTAALAELNRVIPNVSVRYLANTAIRMHWPSAPLFRGSYSSYRFGQWAYREREGRPEGRLYFCGEHCSVDFKRSMEGAAETGALTAARILEDTDIAVPAPLETLVVAKTHVPQPCYRAEQGPRLGPLTRRRRVLREQTALARAWRLRTS